MGEVRVNFPDKNECPKVCCGLGAWKKVPKPAQETTEETKNNQDKDKALPGKPSAANEKKIEPTDFVAIEDYSKPLPPSKISDDFYLPGLKPGPDGKVDWTNLSKLTKTRPTVNKYSLDRYSLPEWRHHNEEVLSQDSIIESNVTEYNAKTAMMQAFGSIDKQQADNTKRLKQKARSLYRWKTEVEIACKAITREVELLEGERQRLKGASRTLMLPEAISKECLDLRSNRAVPDLVSDLAEQELNKEIEVVAQIRANLKKTLEDIEEQLSINKAAKQRIEYDWCDKEMSYNIDSVNIGLNTKSNTIMFRPGATRFSDFSAPLEYWEYFCRENILNCESARQKSEELRGTLNAILVNGGRKLRTQADKTDMALAETVAITQELLTKLEETLRTTLQRIADMENLMDNLHKTIKGMDAAMKLAQTRLENRNLNRPHGEAVRDEAHLGLIEEVKKIHETVTALNGQCNNAERIWKELKERRIILERDIASKRKTLNTDRERCGMIRSHFPSASELAGH